MNKLATLNDVSFKREYSEERRATRYIRIVGEDGKAIYSATRWFPGVHPNSSETVYQRQPNLFLPITREELDD